MDEDDDFDEHVPTKFGEEQEKNPFIPNTTLDLHDIKRARRQIREHATEIEAAQKMRLSMTPGSIEKEGEKVTGVEGEEEDEYEDYEEYKEEEKEKFEPFNLKTEMEEGYFDQDGHYIRQRGDQEDPWEEELKEQERTQGKKIFAVKKKTLAELDEEIAPPSVADINSWKRKLLTFLNPNETVIKALKRLKPTKPTKPTTNQKNVNKSKGNLKNENENINENEKEKEKESLNSFDELTEVADNLMSAGYHNVYSDSKEVIEASLKAVTQKKKRERDNEDKDSGDDKEDSHVSKKNKEENKEDKTPQSTDASQYVWNEALNSYYDPSSGWFFSQSANLYFVSDSQGGYQYWDETTKSWLPFDPNNYKSEESSK